MDNDNYYQVWENHETGEYYVAPEDYDPGICEICNDSDTPLFYSGTADELIDLINNEIDTYKKIIEKLEEIKRLNEKKVGKN